jgi:hypothetical protein
MLLGSEELISFYFAQPSLEFAKADTLTPNFIAVGDNMFDPSAVLTLVVLGHKMGTAGSSDTSICLPIYAVLVPSDGFLEGNS